MGTQSIPSLPHLLTLLNISATAKCRPVLGSEPFDLRQVGKFRYALFKARRERVSACPPVAVESNRVISHGDIKYSTARSTRLASIR
ncbi:hypothetical protein BKA61DRAFT_625020 [Leptodontidium sp. MPI-SDFR-AT-0119]|nr:hypothetical protein BKA61DRAFT_625020 [Leptodontidium sp. MPI-SDFR-AT-0119]